ncbi:MAG: hypothetical protein ACE5IC_07320 [Candidatus Brocadiales bacterium]
MERKMEILRKDGYNKLEIREFMAFCERKYKTIDSLIKEGKLRLPLDSSKL